MLFKLMMFVCQKIVNILQRILFNKKAPRLVSRPTNMLPYSVISARRQALKCQPALVAPEGKVSFFPEVSVVLIPTCNEFKAAGLTNTLWHTCEEYKKMKEDAVDDVKHFIKEQRVKGTELSFKDALKKRCQPDDATEVLDIKPSSTRL